VRAYSVSFADGQHMVSFERDGSLKIDDQLVPIEIQQTDEHTFSVLVNGKSVKVVAYKSQQSYHLLVDSVQQEVIVETERERLLKAYATKGGSTRRRYEVHAPMPALVVKIEVEVGDEVKEGQGLVILEAMKMENEIKSHQRGKVKKIAVAAGKTVEKGELLILLE
jgi:biotin carboxyl carrier protein